MSLFRRLSRVLCVCRGRGRHYIHTCTHTRLFTVFTWCCHTCSVIVYTGAHTLITRRLCVVTSYPVMRRIACSICIVFCRYRANLCNDFIVCFDRICRNRLHLSSSINISKLTQNFGRVNRILDERSGGGYKPHRRFLYIRDDRLPSRLPKVYKSILHVICSE